MIFLYPNGYIEVCFDLLNISMDLSIWLVLKEFYYAQSNCMFKKGVTFCLSPTHYLAALLLCTTKTTRFFQ